ncbi:hypothetical protein KO528_17955 [Saccharophagus degradans]|uniref:RipA family octameric membrane protein n=1 Tax=Saccharophagus degradans TaxID=86304 RepID=UPI001C0928DB|nr:hypothetical protein [Saccharophagus degradans]MBU2987254.1 hypothetical protein [Saccharophagus degradans]
MTKIINTQDEYAKLFTDDPDGVDPKGQNKVAPLNIESKKSKNALKYALEIRKFEIELYWKRASYFWVLIGAAFVGYVAVITGVETYKNELSIVMASLGLVFSCAWLAVNKGSKFWQENWEGHVDMLENSHIGPLYKTVFNNSKKVLSLSGHHFSVSKINLAVSFYVVLVWLSVLIISILLIVFPACIPTSAIVNIAVYILAAITMVFCCGLLFSDWCKSKILKSKQPEKSAILRTPPLSSEAQ